jgi:pilus assembly protein CpaB
MNRNARTLVVVGVAVVIAGLAAFGVYWALLNRTVVERPEPTDDVVVAARDIETGVLLTKEHVKVVAWPRSRKLSATLARLDDVVKRGLIASVVEGEPIVESKLAPKDQSGLPPMIGVGKRAMSVRVNEVIGVAGFVTPGTKVDVLVTLHEAEGGTAHVVVTDVTVLTAGTRYDDAEAKRQGKAIPSTVVTLMVTPAEAEKIALAASEGQIMLALRNPLDKEPSSTPGATLLDLSSGKRPTTTAASTARPQPAQKQTPSVVPASTSKVPPDCFVESIRAGKREVTQCP